MSSLQCNKPTSGPSTSLRSVVRCLVGRVIFFRLILGAVCLPVTISPAASDAVQMVYSKTTEVCREYSDILATWNSGERKVAIPWQVLAKETSDKKFFIESWGVADIDNNGTPDLVGLTQSSIVGELTGSLLIAFDAHTADEGIKRILDQSSTDFLYLPSFPRRMSKERLQLNDIYEEPSRMLRIDTMPIALTAVVTAAILEIQQKNYLNIYDRSILMRREGYGILVEYVPGGRLDVLCITSVK